MKYPMFGSAYYAEYLSHVKPEGNKSRTDLDLSLMAKAGMNTIRIAESTWSTEERSDGVFDFSYIDEVLSCAQKHGLNVIIGTPTYAVPSWLIKKFPDIMLTTKSGKIKYGPRQCIDVFNPDFKRYAERIIRRLIEHTASNPCVIGFQLDNETKHFDNFSPYAQKAFVAYLQKKYVTTEELNKDFTLHYWSNAISSWEDFPDLSNSINGNLLCEYEKFLRSSVTDYLKWQSEIIAEYKRKEQFITHNFDFEWRGYSFGVQPSVNHYDTSSSLTAAGCDIYHPSQDELTGAEIAFCGDSTRSLKNEPYFVMETESQGFKTWTPYPGQLRLQAYSHLASGALGLMYWNWHSIHNSFETYWKGVLGHDMIPGAIYKEASVIGQELKKLGGRICGIKKRNDAALITDNCSLTALKYFPIDEKLSYNNVVRYVYDSLYEMNVECDVVDINALDTSKYKLVIAPALYCISSANAKKLKDFVSSGGVLFATFKSFYADEKATAYSERVPYSLTDCFGMHYNLITQAKNLCVSDSNVHFYAELLEADKAAVVHNYEHKYWSPYAAVTRNVFGSGVSWYYGSYTDKTLLKETLRNVLQDAKIPVLEETFPIIVRSGTNEAGENVHFILNYSSNAASIKCQYDSAKDIITGESFEKNDDVSLSDWGVRVLAE